MKSEAKVEQEETEKTIDKDRGLVMQAAIVRIMKTRKELKYVALVNEVITQLQSRFKPQIGDIKKALETLIERDYLRRSDDEKDTFRYVA